MSLSTLGWIGLPVVCYFIVRPIKNVWLRSTITTAAASIVVFNATKDLPIGRLSTMMGTVLPWMTSIRLIHLMTLPEDQIREMNFLEFVQKFLWFFCPISKNTKEPRPLHKIFIQDTLPNLIITTLKVFASHWMRDWLLACLQEISSSPSLSAGEIVSQNYFKFVIYTLMYGFIVLTTDYIPSNLQPGLCSLLTGDRYQCLPFSDWVVLSNSPRVFWGRRYNKLGE
jgi:hypothetical protein